MYQTPYNIAWQLNMACLYKIVLFKFKILLLYSRSRNTFNY